MKKEIIICIIILLSIPLFVSCVTSEPAIVENVQIEQPEWLANIPHDNNYYFGIGSSDDLSTAKQKAIIDAGQQFSTQVKSVYLEQINENGESLDTVITKLDEQLTDQIVYGAKFVDQYQDIDGFYWVFTRAPLTCLLDITEGMLLSYRLDLKQNEKVMDQILENLETKMDDPLSRRQSWTVKETDGTIRLETLDYNLFNSTSLIWDFNDSFAGWSTEGNEKLSLDRFQDHNVLKIDFKSGTNIITLQSENFDEIDFSNKSIEIKFWVLSEWDFETDDEFQFTAYDKSGSWRGSEGTSNAPSIKKDQWNIQRYDFKSSTRGEGDIKKINSFSFELVGIETMENKIIYIDYVRILKR